ncbi:putative cyclopropane fatty acid synthase [Mycena vitilis]|nr:putative cyclopropane fatty acid synthase [Mycena vitilis]
MPQLHPPTWRAKLLAALSPVSIGSSAIARRMVFYLLARNVIKGQLVVEDSEGTHTFGIRDKNEDPVTMKVHNARLWMRILVSYDLGLSEAYMDGDFDVSDLTGLLNFCLDNRTALAGLGYIDRPMAIMSSLLMNLFGQRSLSLAKWNAEVAYDVSNEFMTCMLSKEMMYSFAFWSDEEGGPLGDLTVGPTEGDLEAAQLRKIRRLLHLCRLRSGDRLLEFGTGWGAMAIEAARMGCTVDTVTLSGEQKALAEERIAEAGYSHCVKVHLCDYRELPEDFAHCFDALVASEMVEAVGARHYDQFFSIVDWALKTDRAAAVFTATGQPEHRYSDYQRNDFVRQYHWPNTHLPSATAIISAVQHAVPGKLVLFKCEDYGIHYPRTLREWGRRLERNFQGDVVTRLIERYPVLSDESKMKAFIRKWTYMFAYAEVGYARAYTSLYCWTFARPENIQVPHLAKPHELAKPLQNGTAKLHY